MQALTVLRTLLLHNNRLNGTILSWLATLTYLKSLGFHNNTLTGTIPSSLDAGTSNAGHQFLADMDYFLSSLVALSAGQ
jgi:hypothetical protein